MYHATAAVSLLAIALYIATSFYAGWMRGKYKVLAPAVTGSPEFERAYRVQMNTLEQLVFFLPSMWLCAMFLNDRGAAIGGLVWIVGRLIYAVSYMRRPASRGPGFGIAFLAQTGLFIGAAIGVVKAMVG